MSTKQTPESIVINIIKDLLQNRKDIHSNDKSIQQIATLALSRGPVKEIITEGASTGKALTEEEVHLEQIIKLLAIINNTMDLVASK